jgi:NADPH:quinone reductase-like Zn-dependent oxidoreductase
MKVLGADVHGDYSVLKFRTMDDYQIKDLQPDDVLIQVSYSDVNPVDLQKLCGRGDNAAVSNPPHVPGYGGSGIVLAVGSNISIPDEWKGRAVCFLGDPGRRMGSYSTHVTVDVRCVARLPLDINSAFDSAELLVSLRDAASIPVAGLTAFESLVKCGLGIKSTNPGIGTDTDGVMQKGLLIIGAAGGVGSWSLTLARALNSRLNIIATATTTAQHEWCKLLGADQVIQHDEITTCLQGGLSGSVDAIICLTEPTPALFSAMSEVIRPYGSICLVVAGKSIEDLNMGFCFFKCADVKTETVFSSIRDKYRTIVPAVELDQILKLMADGTVAAPLSPDLKDGIVSEAFDDATNDNGVLKALNNSVGTRGKFVMKVTL